MQWGQHQVVIELGQWRQVVKKAPAVLAQRPDEVGGCTPVEAEPRMARETATGPRVALAMRPRVVRALVTEPRVARALTKEPRQRVARGVGAAPGAVGLGRQRSERVRHWSL